jgi:hypothetical protein
MDEVSVSAETPIIGNRTDESRRLSSQIRDGVQLVDLSRMLDGPITRLNKYHGICWWDAV